MDRRYEFGRRMARVSFGLVLAVGLGRVAVAADIGPIRLYDGVVVYAPNPDGSPFRVTLEVRDLNHLSRAPAELLVRITDPEGRLAVREVLPDDGVSAPAYAPVVAGWDHEAWHYQSCWTRGVGPMVSWTGLSDLARLAAMPVRTFIFEVPAGLAGVYRVLLAGVPDHVVTVRLTPDRPMGVLSTQNWLHGSGSQYRRSSVYVPRGATRMDLHLLEMDRPATRSLRLLDPAGVDIPLRVVGATEDGTPAPAGFARLEGYFPAPGAYDDQVLTLEVVDGLNAYLVTACFAMSGALPSKRMRHTVNAVLAPDPDTARAIQGGAIYHDGLTFWHGFQVRYHDWLKTLTDADCVIPAGLPARPGYYSPGSHQRPATNSADVWMHGYPAHRNRQVLNAALREMANGLNAIGPGDQVQIGPLKNLAYAMGCYGFFYHRPAWRILRQSDAPDGAKAPIREFILMVGDRLAFCRGGELINGNALASLVQALRYCVEATQDPLQAVLFDAYWDRFANGGFGDRVGIGPSGGIQESFGYDHNYGSYALIGWRAVLEDLKDPRFEAAHERIMNLYSYTHTVGAGGGAWSSRTHGGIAGGSYDPSHPRHGWKGFGGPDFTESVHGANEFFAARRPGYYAVTYHGRLSPSWIGDGFQGQVGHGGGMLALLTIPARGPVLASTAAGSYGAGMHPSQWRNFHLHTLAGLLPDGSPFVAANSEHLDAKLAGWVVTSSGDVRNSSLRAARRYEFADDRIRCEIRLMRGTGDTVYDLWGGRPAWRGRVSEAWELIPFVNPPARQRTPSNETRLWAAVDGGRVELGADPVLTADATVDRGGFGVRVRLLEPRPMKRGENDTLMIQAAAGLSEAEAVVLEYELIPFVAETPGKGE